MAKTEKQTEMVKTSLKMPRELWRAVHIRALDDGDEFQKIVWKALEAYLRKGAGR